MLKISNITSRIILAALLLTLAVVAVAYAGMSDRIKSKHELLNFKNANASVVMSEDGQLLGKYFYENRTNITSDQLPGHLVDALIATEDVRFYDHHGTDPRSFLRVLFKSILMNDRSSGGGSTITQQLAKNMFGRTTSGFMPMVSNKISELIMARRIEKVYSKNDILTLYLNTVAFGENVFGIEAASVRFFNKSTGDLAVEESAVLVGMLKANTFYNPRRNPENARARRNVVLGQMKKYKFLDTLTADSISLLPMVIDYSRKTRSEGIADYFLVQVKKEAEEVLRGYNSPDGSEWDLERDGLVITTTLNFSLQDYAVRSFREHLQIMQKRLDSQYRTSSGRRALEQITASELKRLGLENRASEMRVQEIFSWDSTYTDSLSVSDSLKRSLTLMHAGLMAMDPVSGGIKAWVGGLDFKTQPYDQILARRQLASVFKPVLYAAALEDGFEPCHYLDNDSITLSGFDDWSPENFDHSYGGKYSLSGALAHSMNVPTFSLFLEIGFEKVNAMWRKMRFSFELDNTPSLALGTAEANIREIAVAYSSFVNGGYRIGPWCISSIATSSGKLIYSRETTGEKIRIMTDRTGNLMSAMLQKAIREGTGVSMSGVYGVDFPLAGKTGTSQDYSDAWFAAFNPGLVMVSRAGASSRSIHFNSGSNGTGSALALPLVALTLKKMKQNRTLSQSLIKPFPELPPELAGALDCPDFKEESFFDIIIDIFEKDEKEYDTPERRVQRRVNSILRKILKRRRYER